MDDLPSRPPIGCLSPLTLMQFRPDYRQPGRSEGPEMKHGLHPQPYIEFYNNIKANRYERPGKFHSCQVSEAERLD